MKSRRKVNLRPAVFAVVLVFALNQTTTIKANQPSGANRGELLAADCHACHSPKVFTEKGPVPDPERIFAGHPADSPLPEIPENLIAPQKWGGLFTNDLTAWVGPWGISYGTNLTPDKETGIGLWSFEDFKDVLRTGMFHDGSRRFLPPMPSAPFVPMSDDDLRAMYDYFMSLEPVVNKVPDPVPPNKLKTP